MIQPTHVQVGGGAVGRPFPVGGGDLTPASALPGGLASPLSPSPPAPAFVQGPVPRGRHAAAAQQQQQYGVPAAAPRDPWSSAASNPFPSVSSSVPGAQLGYYQMPAETSMHSSASSLLNAHPHHSVPSVHTSHLQYAGHNNSSSSSNGISAFLVPSGEGQSPLPDDEFLPTTDRRGYKKRWMHQLKLKLINKGRPTRTVVIVAGTIVALVLLLFLVARWRSSADAALEQARSTQKYIPPTSGARARAHEQMNMRRPVADGVSLGTNGADQLNSGAATPPAAPSPPPVYKPHEEHHKARVAAAAHHHEKSGASKAHLLDQGLAEIRRLKASLKDMKQKLKAEQRAKQAARGAEDDEDHHQDPEDDAMLDPEDVEIAIERFRSEHPASHLSLEEEEALEHEMDHAAAHAHDHHDDEPPDALLNGGYYDYFVSEWSDCSVTCGEGVQTRGIICQHTKTGREVDISVCEDAEPQPRSSRKCRMAPCVDDSEQRENTEAVAAGVVLEETESAAISDGGADPSPTHLSSTPVPSNPAQAWPTLAQYAPDWSVAEADRKNTCPSERWGREFLAHAWMESDTEVQCGVELNADEHASVELIRFPPPNLPHLSAAMPHEQIVSNHLSDSFYKLRHALFHPTAVRYTAANSKSPTKEALEGSGNRATKESYGISLDCTAVSGLRTRLHSDESAASFLRALHFLNPHSPPLVNPSDPSSKSIFTRAFERMSDAEFETTTFFVERTCRPPFSAAQCMPDLFAVFAIAHTLQVEFAQLRIIFLDEQEETPWFSAWGRLAREGQVFTKTMWSDLRVAPFDEDDVYATNAVYVVPSAVHALWTLGESVFAVPNAPGVETFDAFEKQRCAGPSALHQAFSHLMADSFLGFGAHAAAAAARVGGENDLAAAGVANKTPPVMLVAQGGGGIVVPSAKGSSSGSGGSNGSDDDAPIRLHNSGRKVSNMDSLLSAVGEAFPSLRLHSFPHKQGFPTQLSLLTHANVLLSVRHSVAFNALLFAAHPQSMHVIEARGRSDTAEEGRKAVKALSRPSIPSMLSYAEQVLPLSTSQGLNVASATVVRTAATAMLHGVSASAHAIFSARWLCEKLGCASYHELSAAEEDTDGLRIDPARVVSLLEDLQPAVVPRAVGAAVDSSDSEGQKGAQANTRQQQLEEYEPSAEEVAAEEKALRAAAALRAEQRAAAAESHAPAMGGPSRPLSGGGHGANRVNNGLRSPPPPAAASNGNAGSSHRRPEEPERHTRAARPFIRKGLKARAAAAARGN